VFKRGAGKPGTGPAWRAFTALELHSTRSQAGGHPPGMNTKEPESADEHCLSELEASMNSVQIDQKSYEMPPREGISIACFLTVADVEGAGPALAFCL
jgi:hypothetical protein